MCLLAQVAHASCPCISTPSHAQTRWLYTVPTLTSLSLSLAPLIPHCGLINTYWPSQIFVFCSKIVVIPYDLQFAAIGKRGNALTSTGSAKSIPHHRQHENSITIHLLGRRLADHIPPHSDTEDQ
ncbi:unnamed protein product [Hymenolepis diminuta]|uniref:Uncharacterized protein n=1 Tax=Hymenolepis diminuta TaxID=6216 RepID=A0A564YMS0_HYMDI|nr:unnamed protein product [Hymenolepis diminuta]